MDVYGGAKSLNWDHKKYPNLLLKDLFTVNDIETEELNENMSDENFMKKHLVSMLRYMSKQGKFFSMMKEDIDTYSNAADYVEKNGLTVYGFVVLVDKDELLKIDEVYLIYTQPLK